jgi:hypothetical protein
MSSLSDVVVSACLRTLERPDVRENIEGIVRPIVSIILDRLYPYVLVIVALVIAMFVMLAWALASISRIAKTLAVKAISPRVA